MKSMKDTAMGMKGGEDSFFPTEAKMKVLPKAGQIKDFKYPDTEEAILASQNATIKAISGHEPKAGFRN